MFIQQLYTNCLAQAAYYVESNGEAAVIDPLRDPEPYLELARQRGASIKYIFETHFHADFVSGHLDLARITGAVIVYGPNAKPGYAAIVAGDGEKFHLGKMKVEVLHTPGHTVESSCLLLLDENEKPQAVFTGDTLFVGDVGRPDLMSGNLSKEKLAEMLFDSLNQKLKKLPDELVVYPGHGAGSACGKNIGKETSTTIGAQKKNNYAMLENDKKKFVEIVTSDLPVPPPYFFKDAAINIGGYGSYDNAFVKANQALSVTDFRKEIAKGACVIDARSADQFADAFIPTSVNIGLNGEFAVWVGTVIPFETPVLLVTEPGKESESIKRLLRVGYENISGYLEGGIDSWKREGQEIDSVKTIDAEGTKKLIDSDQYILLDVRRPGEAIKERVKRSILIPLNELPAAIKRLDPSMKYLVYCAGGYRSMIAASLLKRAGIRQVCNVQGGINKIKTEQPELIGLI